MYSSTFSAPLRELIRYKVMKHFSQTLQEWYHAHHRQLPWRETVDPYKIWLSEIILQQTQVVQGLSYYHKFIEEFPTVNDLAEADQDRVLLLWQGLGYYSRARNLHAASQQIVNDFGGVFPSTYKEILSLKGVGEYTAAAVASFAFKLPHAVVDGNVYRVLSRIFGIDTPIDTGAGKKQFSQLATELLDGANPDIHNQAIMEFGALQCKPKSPDCNICPFKSECVALKNGLIENLPLKSRKTKVRNRYFHYLKVSVKDSVAIEKRPTGDIWAALYQFPLIETETSIELDQLQSLDLWKVIFANSQINSIEKSDLVTHQLSHQKLHTYFYHIVLDENRTDLTFVKKTELNNYAFPQLIQNQLVPPE